MPYKTSNDVLLVSRFRLFLLSNLNGRSGFYLFDDFVGRFVLHRALPQQAKRNLLRHVTINFFANKHDDSKVRPLVSRLQYRDAAGFLLARGRKLATHSISSIYRLIQPNLTLN